MPAVETRKPTVEELEKAITENRESLEYMSDLRGRLEANRLTPDQENAERSRIMEEYGGTVAGKPGEFLADVIFLAGQFESIGGHLEAKHRSALAEQREREERENPESGQTAMRLREEAGKLAAAIESHEAARSRLIRQVFIDEGYGAAGDLDAVEAHLASLRAKQSYISEALDLLKNQ